MFQLRREVRLQFLEVQARLDARGDKVWIEHHIHPSSEATNHDSAFYHKVARRVARRVRRRFGCKAQAIKFLGYDNCDWLMPKYKLIISFI